MLCRGVRKKPEMNRIRRSRIYRPILAWRTAQTVTRWTPADESARRFYASLIPPGSLVFDVGANLGKRTKVFLRLGARVVAVEPQRECVQVLRLAFGRRTVVIPKALAETEGEGRIRIDESSTLSSMSDEWIHDVRASGRFADHRWARAVGVETTTLDRLIETYGPPRFAKIDVEGFELHVLRGLSRAIPSLSIETVPERLEATRQCLGHLATLGEMELNYSFGESMQWVFREWVSLKEMLAFLERIVASQEEGAGDLYVRYL
jgi:FkbM family methyltransferase